MSLPAANREASSSRLDGANAMRRASARIVLWGSVFAVVAIVAATSLWMWLDATAQVRNWLAETVSAAIGKKVTIRGPVTWTFSLEPTIVLRQVAVTEQSDGGLSDLATADRVEVVIVLPSLLRRSIVIPSLAVTDLDVVLTETPVAEEAHDRPVIQADAPKSESSGFAVQIHAIRFTRAGATFSPAPGAAMERATLREATLDMVPDQPTRLVASGAFREVPFTIDATGGRFLDVSSGRHHWWPLALKAQTPKFTLTVDGNIGLPLGSSLVDVQLTASGPRLDGLNQVLAVDWPALGPYSLSGRVTAADGEVSIHELNATLGASDLTGEASLRYRQGRPRVSATLASQRFDLNDVLTDAGGSEDADFIEWLKAWDLAVTMTCESVVLGERALGSLRAEAHVDAGLLQVRVPTADLMGARIEGRAEIDARPAVPALSLAVTGRGFEPGLLRRNASRQPIGMSDVVLRAQAYGATWEALLSSLTISLRTDQSVFLLHDPLSGRPIELSLGQGQATLAASGPGAINLAGRYGLRPFRIHATTGSVSALLADQAWPIKAVLRSGEARLLVDATMRQPFNHESWAVHVRARGRSLDEFASSLPATGPFRLSGEASGDRGESWRATFAWQIGGSDGTGWLDVATERDRLAVTADLMSRRLRAADFMVGTASHEHRGSLLSGRGSLSTSEISPRLVADVHWKVDRLHAGPVHLRRVLLHITADRGRIESVSSATHRHGDMNAILTFEAHDAPPRLKAQAWVRHVDYGALLREVQMTDRVAGTTDLALDLTSEGSTAEELMDRVAFNITATLSALRMAEIGDKEVGPVTLSGVSMSGRIHEPLILSLQGHARGLPFTLIATSVPLEQVLGMPASLPWTLVIRGPGLTLDAQGRAGFQARTGTADFRVSLKGTSLPRLAALFNRRLPELGSYEFSGDVAYASKRVTLTDVRARAGKSDVAGRVEILWREPRPRVTGTFWSKLVDLEVSERPGSKADRMESEEPSLEAATDSAPDATGLRIIPDWRLPIEALHSMELDLLWTIQRLSVSPIQADEIIAALTLKDGILTAGPLELTHNGSMKTGRFTIDGTGKVPRAAIEITATDVDYGGLFNALKITDKVEGRADIYLTAEGQGRDLRELMGAANGHLEIVAGSATWENRFIHLWASNLMKAMLSQAWRRESSSQYHCGAAYFDIRNGEMETDALLIDASDYSIAGAGTLSLATEDLDVVVTPRPKSLAILSLAVPVRLTGLLAAPRVSTSSTSIAASKAWKVLDIADPIGLALQVPRVILGDQATAAGSLLENPCTVALQRDGKGTLTTRKVVTSGFDWVADFFRRAGSAGARWLQGRPGASAGEGT